ncbi:hypothetical protein J5U22_01440 [Saccharolobus shibatae]|uniref:Transposase n=1 Tax=Saccharolobus shibatae TaxID=2286 RepID=A0A8F5C0P7_9CREN|nr:hypothetical protein J5U22_01440 [Saccharolobus shibatae]
MTNVIVYLKKNDAPILTKDEIVKFLVEQVVAMGFKIKLLTLDAGFYTIEVLQFISQFNYIIAVPAGDVKIYKEYDGEYTTNSKRKKKMSKLSSD